MATNQKQRYPMMPTRQWWALREQFKRTMPSAVTTSYLASALNMNERSASANILPALSQTKLIDEDGKPTDRAVRWRDDEQYPQVCAEIRDEVYPKELIDLAPSGSTDRSKVRRWLAGATGHGEAAAKKMTTFYALLAEADPEKANEAPTASNRRRPEKTTAKRATASRKATGKRGASKSTDPQGDGSFDPTLHLTVQVHIPVDASPEQIDQIFASMGRHLRRTA